MDHECISNLFKSMNPIIHIFKTPENLSDAFAQQLIIWINECPHELFHIALSGGTTPSLLYRLLADKYLNKVPWEKIHFWWGDERMVNPENPESNFGVVKKLLFSKINLPESQIHRIIGENEIHQETKRYESEILKNIWHNKNGPVFDLIILGMGDDGHTASIFPGQIHLMEVREITAIARHPVTGQQRITLTGKVINNAARVAFLVTGESKSDIFKQIIDNSPDAAHYPASHINPRGELHWFIDEGIDKK